MSSWPDLLILDVDGTLRWTIVPDQVCPFRPEEWRLLPGVRERLSAVDWSRCRLGVASNQTPVAAGHLTPELALSMIEDTLVAAIGFLPAEALIEICTCAPELDCSCRKPRPGMLVRLLERSGIPAPRALFVGDLPIDEDAARAAGVAFAWAGDFFASRPR